MSNTKINLKDIEFFLSNYPNLINIIALIIALASLIIATNSEAKTSRGAQLEIVDISILPKNISAMIDSGEYNIQNSIGTVKLYKDTEDTNKYDKYDYYEYYKAGSFTGDQIEITLKNTGSMLSKNILVDILMDGMVVEYIGNDGSTKNNIEYDGGNGWLHSVIPVNAPLFARLTSKLPEDFTIHAGMTKSIYIDIEDDYNLFMYPNGGEMSISVHGDNSKVKTYSIPFSFRN